VPALAVRLAAGQGFRAPSFKEMFLFLDHSGYGYVMEGNPDLVPERSFNLSAGLEAAPAGWITLSLGGFRNQLEDMITEGLIEDATETAAQRWGYLNIAEAITQGIETNARVALRDLVRLDLGYTYTYTLDVENDRPLDGRAPHRGTASVMVGHPGWGLNGNVRGVFVGSSQFYLDIGDDDVGDEVVIEPYISLDARLQKRVLRTRFAVFAGVDNILNAGDALYIHLDPRMFYGGFTFYHPPWGD